MTVEAHAAFAKALAAFQAEVPAVGKDQTANTGSYSYTYTDLAALTSKVLPVLSKHGLSWIARPTMTDHGFVLTYSLLHEAGHREDGDYPLPDPTKHKPQEIGSAITYARRYAFCSLTGIAPGGEDDDGQAAAQARSAPRQQPQQQRRPAADPVLAAAKSELWRAAQALLWSTEMLEEDFAKQNGGLTLGSATAAQLDAYRMQLQSDEVPA